VKAKVLGILIAIFSIVSQSAYARAPAPAPPPMDAETAQLIEKLGLIEAEKKVSEMPGWKRPRKVVVLYAAPFSQTLIESYRAVAPGVKVIEAKGSAAALALIRDADGLIGVCDPGVIAAGKQLKWIHAFTAGVEDCARIPVLQERGILLTNAQRVQGPVMAEHTIGLMIALSRNFERWIQNQQTGVWRGDGYRQDTMQTLAGKTLLVSGLGGIGTEVARRAHALGMNVIATRASGKDKPEFVSQIGGPDELPALIRQADFVVNSTPLTEQTRGLFNARLFAAMKPSAYFINVGRGGSVVTDDLVEALKRGVIAGAGVDVTDPEPLPPEHPLWRAPNIIITPHVSAHAKLALEPTMIVARENLRRYTAGEKMLSVVDPSRGY